MFSIQSLTVHRRQQVYEFVLAWPGFVKHCEVSVRDTINSCGRLIYHFKKLFCMNNTIKVSGKSPPKYLSEILILLSFLYFTGSGSTFSGTAACPAQGCGISFTVRGRQRCYGGKHSLLTRHRLPLGALCHATCVMRRVPRFCAR